MQRWENTPKSRYYLVEVQQNLFGEWELVRIWGGIESAQGRRIVTPLGTPSEGQGALVDIAARRAQRGYRLVRSAVPSP